MVKPYFQDIDIECWVYPGKLGDTQPSICLLRATAEPSTPILLALEELESEGPPSHRTLSLRPSRRKRSVSALRLRLVAESEQLRVMNISCTRAVVTIEMTQAGLSVIRDAITDWGNGAGDFGISSRHTGLKKRQLRPRDVTSGELWFWGPAYEP
jgi:hypothetical protein